MALPKWLRRRREPFVSEERSNLGNVLLAMGVVTSQQLEKAVNHLDKEEQMRIGMRLVSMGFITETQLGEALEAQRLYRSGEEVEAQIRVNECKTEVLKRSISTNWVVPEPVKA